MSRLASVLLLGAFFALPARPARAEDPGAALDESTPVPVNLSTELLDTAAFSRFHLVSRASFTDGESVFTDASTWSFEARANIRVTRGLTLAATLPFGLIVPGEGQKEFFFGNFSLGVAGGGTIHLGRGATESPGVRLRLGAAADVYAPTAPKPADDDLFLALAEVSVASLRGLEPWLYLSNQMAFRGRLQAGVTVSILTASFELGLTPAFTLESSSDFLMWLSASGRLSALVHPAIEPFLEGGSAILVVKPRGDFSPPFQLTPGVRFHFGAFDPAIFASISLSNSALVVFGVDLAGAFVPSRRSESERMEDFLGDME